ncbi:MAG: TonB-dependent receptor [Verrucomicrobia bacterium]|nr:TonB-dependent receptor [Verrucomicrobiota bacterium]
MKPNIRLNNGLHALCKHAAIFVSGAYCLTAPVSAQTTAEDEVIELSPFEVRADRDRGYIATTQISATRLQTEIRELPFFLSVVTPELIRDTGADTLDSMLRFVPGVQQRPQQAFYDTGFFMRGQEVNFIFRDGLRLFRSPAPDNVERVEVLKGPAAVLYGESAPGGGINFISKLPRWDNIASVELRADSFGYFSSLVDVNSVVRENNVAARMVVSGGYGDGWHDLETRRHWMVAPSVTFRYAPGSQLTLSLEHFENYRRNHLNNGFFAWNGPDDVGGVAPDGSSMRPIGIHPSMRMTDNPFANSYYDEFNTMLIGDLQHRFSQWITYRGVVAYSRGQAETAGAVVNDRPMRTNGAGGTLIDADVLNGQVMRVTTNFNSEAVLRNEVVLSNDRNSPIYVRTLLGMDYIDARFRLRRMANENRFNASTVGQQPFYLAYNARTGERFGLAVPGAVNLRDQELVTQTYEGNKRYGYYAISQIRMLNDDLNLLLGVRHHRLDRTNLANNTAVGKTSATTPQFGVSYNITAEITAFASYSESFRPQLGNDARGNPFSPLQGEGFDFGVKVSLLDDRVIGTISAFENTLTGLIRSDFSFQRPDGTFGGAFSSGEERSRGIDIDLMVEPFRGWQTILGVTFLDTEILSNTQQPQLVGLRTINSAKFYATAWTRYNFRETIEGLWIGGGISHVGGNRVTRYSWAFENSSYTLFDIAAGYSTEIGGLGVSAQINLRNVFDKNYFVHEAFPGRPRDLAISLRVEF